MVSVVWLLPTSLALSYIMPLHCFFWSRNSFLPHTWHVLSHLRALAPAFPSIFRNLLLIFAYLTNTHLSDLSSKVSSSGNLSLTSSPSCPVICLFFAVFMSPVIAQWSFSCLVHEHGCFCGVFYSRACHSASYIVGTL